jgi:hypothetical protein
MSIILLVGVSTLIAGSLWIPKRRSLTLEDRLWVNLLDKLTLHRESK